MSNGWIVPSAGQWEYEHNGYPHPHPIPEETQLGAPYPRDSARSPHPSAGRTPGSAGRGAPDRAAPPGHVGPTGPFPRPGAARTPADPARHGGPGAEHDLAPDRFGRDPAARAARGRLPVDRPGRSLRAGSQPTPARLPGRIVPARPAGPAAPDAGALAGAPAAPATRAGLGPGALPGRAGRGWLDPGRAAAQGRP